MIASMATISDWHLKTKQEFLAENSLSMSNGSVDMELGHSRRYIWEAGEPKMKTLSNKQLSLCSSMDDS